MYNNTMKKRTKPQTYGMKTQAIRKAMAQEVFQDLLKNPHLVVTPKQHKGTRSANKRKAIAEQ